MYRLTVRASGAQGPGKPDKMYYIRKYIVCVDTYIDR